jgi:hypothetical protein
MGDGDGKLALFLIDIKDGYPNETHKGYVPAYWRKADLTDGKDHANQMDMIYVDTYPGTPGSSESYAAIAHELQHFMNFVTGTVKRTGAVPMDTWIDEGLSTAAEYIYLAPNHAQERIDWFNQDPSGSIVEGNNFFVWGNHYAKYPNAVLDDAASAYLFFQWLRIQHRDYAELSGYPTPETFYKDAPGDSLYGASIYTDIITSQYFDYRAVTAAAVKNIDSAVVTESPPNTVDKDYSDWGTLIGDWLAANYLNSVATEDSIPLRYGYKGELAVRVWVAESSEGAFNGPPSYDAPTWVGTNIPKYLYPGEGVYSFYSTNTKSIGTVYLAAPSSFRRGVATGKQQPVQLYRSYPVASALMPDEYSDTAEPGAPTPYNYVWNGGKYFGERFLVYNTNMNQTGTIYGTLPYLSLDPTRINSPPYAKVEKYIHPAAEVKPPLLASPTATSRVWSAKGMTEARPYVIDARDILRRKGLE